MKVVVTGGAGFVGAHLTRALLAAGCEVVVVDDLSTGAMSNLGGLPVRLVVGSVTDRTLLEEVCVGAASIVHLAARTSVERSLLDPMATHEVNATGTLTVLDVAYRGETHVVVASSAAVYGGPYGWPGAADLGPPLLGEAAGRAAGRLGPDHGTGEPACGGGPAGRAAGYGAGDPRPCAEHDQPRPGSPYAASKLAAESYALAYQAGFGLPVLVARLFDVFGPYQSPRHADTAVIPSFVAAALAGRPLVVPGDGRQLRDFTYVEQVAAVLADAACRGVVHDGPVNLATGTATDPLAVIGHLERILGRTLDIEHTTAPAFAEYMGDRWADTGVMRSLFPDVPGIDLGEALAHTVAWYESRATAARAEADVPSAIR